MQPPAHPTLLTSRKPFLDLEAAEGKAPVASESESSASEAKLEYVFLNVDFKPYLPQVFTGSTVLGAVCLFAFQLRLLCDVLHLPQVPVFGCWGALVAATFGCMWYAASRDPGQVQEEGATGPARSHKSWMYARPIRRHDHYCKWINNVIGLFNHRAFILMVFGLATMGVLGLLVDGYLMVAFFQQNHIAIEVCMLLHAAYSAILLHIVLPILDIHRGLITRNELGQEWKTRKYWVADCSLGDSIPVGDIDDASEYNELFDSGAFVYEPSRNPYDHGILANWVAFWFTPRWSDTAGDF